MRERENCVINKESNTMKKEKGNIKHTMQKGSKCECFLGCHRDNKRQTKRERKIKFEKFI